MSTVRDDSRGVAPKIRGCPLGDKQGGLIRESAGIQVGSTRPVVRLAQGDMQRSVRF